MLTDVVAQTRRGLTLPESVTNVIRFMKAENPILVYSVRPQYIISRMDAASPPPSGRFWNPIFEERAGELLEFRNRWGEGRVNNCAMKW